MRAPPGPDFPLHRPLTHPRLRALRVNRTPSSSPPSQASPHALLHRSPPTCHVLRPRFDARLSRMARDAHGHVLFTSRRPDRAHGPPRRLQRRPLTTASQRATPPRNPIYIPRNRLVNHPQPFPVILRSSYHSLCMPFVPATDACNPIYFPTPANASLSLTLLQTHLCRNDPASARGSLLRSPPPHPSSLPSPPVPSGLPRAHFPPLSTSTPLPLTPPFSPLPHTSLNPHPSEFRPSAP